MNKGFRRGLFLKCPACNEHTWMFVDQTTFLCPFCRTTVDVRIFEHKISASGETPCCTNHENAEAIGTCDTCGANVCEVCMTGMGNLISCPECIDATADKALLEAPEDTKEASTESQISWAGVAFEMLFFSFFIPLLSIITMFFSFLELTKPSIEGTRLGRRTLILVGFLSLIPTALWVLLGNLLFSSKGRILHDIW